MFSRIGELEIMVGEDDFFYIMYMLGMMGLFKGVVYMYDLVFWGVLMINVIFD